MGQKYTNISDLYKQVKLNEREIIERKLTPQELEDRERIAKKLPMADFKKRYGKDAMAVKMAVATNMAKAKNETIEDELGEKYNLYHSTFSGAMQHAYDYAKKKMGITVDPKEIDSKVATGPKKPTEGKTNKYRLKGKGGNLQIQVYNKGGSKPFELNMYKEETELDEMIPKSTMYALVKDGKVIAKGSKRDMVSKMKKEGGKVFNAPSKKVGDTMKESLDEKFTKKDFAKNEDENQHTKNAIELVKMFGTSAEDIKVNAIAARHNMKGSISRKDQQDRDAIIKKYYPKLKEEVEINEDGHQDVASAIRQCKTITEDAMQILQKLQTMSPEDALPTWWTNKLAVASNSMNKMRDYLLVPSVSEEVELNEAEVSVYGFISTGARKKFLDNLNDMRLQFKSKVMNLPQPAPPSGVLKFDANQSTIEAIIKFAKRISKTQKKIKLIYLDHIIKSSRIIDVINYFMKKKRIKNIYLIIGSDNLLRFHKWKSWKKILKLVKLIVFSRKGYDRKGMKSIVVKNFKNKIIFIKNKHIAISSSQLKSQTKSNN